MWQCTVDKMYMFLLINTVEQVVLRILKTVRIFDPLVEKLKKTQVMVQKEARTTTTFTFILY